MVEILSSQISIIAETVKGVKSFEIVGNEFGGVREEVTDSGRVVRRAVIGPSWRIGRTSDKKKAKDYIQKCREKGDIVTLDLPETARF
jgi:hypothetical protein